MLPLTPVGAVALLFEAERPDPSLAADLQKLATAILDDPPDATSATQSEMKKLEPMFRSK